MKKPIKPFAVELRRTGKKLTTLPAKHLATLAEAEPAALARVAVAWPSPEDEYVSDARRAADKLFASSSRPLDTSAGPAPDPNDGRRVLPSLDEPDFIARILQEEEASRPRRGRKPGSGLAVVRRATLRAPAQEVIAAPPLRETLLPVKIAGYVRGRIFARYARRSEPGLGQFWRKPVRPAW